MFERPITRTPSHLSGNPTGTQFVGATLVVVYRLVTPGNPRIAPLRSVVIYDGAFTGVASKSPSLNQTMGGFYQASTSPSAKMTQIVGGATSKGFTETLTVNGSIPQGVPSNPFVGAQGANWDNYTFNYNLAPNASSVADARCRVPAIVSRGAQSSPAPTSRTRISTVFWTYGRHPDCILNPGSPERWHVQLPPHRRHVWHMYGADDPTTCVNFPAMGAKPIGSRHFHPDRLDAVAPSVASHTCS